MNKYELAAKRHLAAKEAGWGDEALQGIQHPLSTLNGYYNPYGAALLGGGTGLATYLISRLLGMKGGPSLIASLLGGLGGAHYALGKQYAGKNPYNPFNIDYLRQIINKMRGPQTAPSDQQANGAYDHDPNAPANSRVPVEPPIENMPESSEADSAGEQPMPAVSQPKVSPQVPVITPAQAAAERHMQALSDHQKQLVNQHPFTSDGYTQRDPVLSKAEEMMGRTAKDQFTPRTPFKDSSPLYDINREGQLTPHWYTD